MKSFKHKLGDTVKLKHSDESGEVRARSESLTAEDQYFLVYKDADGRQVSAWWGAADLADDI